MNEAMYENAATQENLSVLRERGFTFVDPESGFLAERERGVGRLASEEALLEAIQTVLARSQSLHGRRVLVTAGPTREAFDPVRFVSNPSTGAMGISIAREAAARGADVTLVLGPTHLHGPPGVRVVHVESAQQMYDATLERLADAQIVIAAAAVSDWRPAQREDRKRKKSDQDLHVTMTRNADILGAVGERKDRRFIFGFAAETDNHEANAREKLQRKRLDAIAVNDVSENRGFGTQKNALTVLWGRDGRRELGEASKDVLAARLLDCMEELMRGDTDAARD
jgi:phosphopantothenoylcysteine decarboxylase/phosphopantothenate--cysteine ligase